MRKLIENLEEAKGDIDALVKKIARLVNRNDHAEAIIVAAKYLGAKSIVDRVKLVDKLHDLEGGMPYELITYRNSLQKAVKDEAKKKLSPEDWDKFEAAF